MAGFVTSWKIKLDGPLEIDGGPLLTDLPKDFRGQPLRAATPAIAVARSTAVKAEIPFQHRAPAAVSKRRRQSPSNHD
jgi:hypothetical protein